MQTCKHIFVASKEVCSIEIRLFPASSSQTRTSGVDAELLELTIFNGIGQRVFPRIAGATIDLAGYSPGMYFVKVQYDNTQTEFIKIIKSQ
jgi:hypothetical protein